MEKFSSQRVSDFMLDIQSLSVEKYEMAKTVRDMHFDCDPNISEDIKYGGLVFLKQNELVSGIFFYKNHNSIEFSEGANFSDPHSVLEGSGKLRRHIKISSLEDIKTKNVLYYIQQALTLK